MDKPKLTDLIDVDILQKIQDGFSEITGMAALITDEEGIPVTTGSNFCDYCKKYTRMSEIGRINCEECDKQGALVIIITLGSHCSHTWEPLYFHYNYHAWEPP